MEAAEMKIKLAVWTAVEGYGWQPGSAYLPEELADYKREIGPLVPGTLPLGGLFIKDGKVVFYRVQIAERMDSRGRDAIYCLLGRVPEDEAGAVDFAAVFNSPEMAVAQKPFPTAIELDSAPGECKSHLGGEGFRERSFSGAETFSELGGWCQEARGGMLRVRIDGSMDCPLFKVNYTPRAVPASVPPSLPRTVEPSKPYPSCEAERPLDCHTPNSQGPEKSRSWFTFRNGLVVGFSAGTFVAWLVCRYWCRW